MELPHDLIKALQRIDGFEERGFVKAHEMSAPTSIRLNARKIERHSSCENAQALSNHLTAVIKNGIPWCSAGYYLHQRLSFTFDPFFHAGCYYVQEASSMFLEEACRQLIDLSKSHNALDLCGAPGGKSTHLQSLLSRESLLVCNEVIRSRSGILKDNIIKWGGSNVFVTNNDPSAFQAAPNFFDLLVVDAPCSGSGLFRKDQSAIEEWSMNNVVLCCQRQKRIIADALPALRDGGVLIYSTCSYSEEENEDVCDWLTGEFGLESLQLVLNNSWGVVPVTSKIHKAAGYRFFPNVTEGEGFFTACFRKNTSSEGNKKNRIQEKSKQVEKASAKEKAIVENVLENANGNFIKIQNRIIFLPANKLQDLNELSSALNIRYAGIAMGEVMKDKLIPDHALAMSNEMNKNVQSIDLDEEQAIKYLQRAEFQLASNIRGWTLMKYKNYPLGWANLLGNRLNNYYPKELRILKAQDDRPSQKL